MATQATGTATILIVDDEPQIRRFLRVSLSAEGYTVLEAPTAREGLDTAALKSPELVILDLGLPDMDGLEALGELREWSQVPVIVLSIRSDESDKVAALDLGANDYVTKPFGMAELLARIRAALRQKGSAPADDPMIKAGDIEIDLAHRQVRRRGVPVKLSRKEYEILRLCALNANKVITHGHLLGEVWGPAHVEETQYLRVYMGQLRQKLEEDASSPRHLITEAGVGYRFVTDPPDPGGA